MCFLQCNSVLTINPSKRNRTRKPKPASKASTSKTSTKIPTSARAARIKKKEPVQHEESEEEYDSQEIDKPALRTMPSDSEAVVDVVGELNLFDARTSLFMTQADDVRCRLVRAGQFSCEFQQYHVFNF